MVKKKSIFPLTKLSDVVSMKSGESITAERITSEGKFPCFGGNGLRGYTTTFTHDGSYTLVGRQGALCGNVTFVSGRFYASEHAIVVTPKKETDIKFMSYVLYDMNLNQYSESSAQPGLSVKKLLELEYPIPQNKEEQTAIAEALSDIDSLISSLQKLIEKEKAIKQGAMQELLTGKKRLPGFSEEWSKQQLGDICNIVNGGTPSTSIAEFWNGKILWCTPTDITSCSTKYIYTTESKITESGLKASSATLLPKGALLLCSRATIGEVRIAGNTICTNQGFKSLVVHQNISNEWLYYMVHILKFNMLEKAIGSTFLEISKKDLAELDIVVPEFTEQKAIAQVLSDMDSEIEQLEKNLAKYQQIKQGMMQELLTGRIRLVDVENNE